MGLLSSIGGLLGGGSKSKSTSSATNSVDSTIAVTPIVAIKLDVPKVQQVVDAMSGGAPASALAAGGGIDVMTALLLGGAALLFFTRKG